MAARRVAVAASGGRDSTALLHCTVRQAGALGIDVVALHVHHGLQPQAEAWLKQVQKQALRWGAQFQYTRLKSRPEPGASVEAWARRERYRALADLAQSAGCDLVLLAHHRRDQAETWLLQALRGAGAAGLSAMPVQAQRKGLGWARPWLDQPRDAIEAYVRRHRLSFVDDTSNADPRFARNRLRAQVWPALQAAFPDLETALTNAARHAQHAAALAQEVAALDLAAVQREAGLNLDAWRELPPARRLNVLRVWLRTVLPAADVADSLVHRLTVELPVADTGRWPATPGELRLYRSLLTWDAPARSTAASAVSAPDGAPIWDAAPDLDLSQPGVYPLPAWQGQFEVRDTTQAGIAPQHLQQVRLLERVGSEQFSLAPQRPLRSLKKQFQAQAVPAWLRQGPLVWAASGELLYVPGLGMNGAYLAPAGQTQLILRWVPLHGVPKPAG